MLESMINGILVEGLLYGIMVLGVWITFRILDFPDLTVDGSFPMGAAIMAVLLMNGVPVLLSLLLAMFGGILAGFVTALIHNHLKIPGLLAGILTMTMLYSVNLRILGNKPNLPIIRQETVMTMIKNLTGGLIPPELAVLLFFIGIVLLVKLLLDLFLHTDLGLLIRALGNNQQMVLGQGVNIKTLKLLGVGLSNGLVALSGAFASQYQGFADVNLGQGIIISGLASVMIGEVIIPSRNIVMMTFRAVLGSIAYKAVMFAGREWGYVIGLTPNDLKLITGLLIVAILIFTNLKKWSTGNKMKINGVRS